MQRREKPACPISNRCSPLTKVPCVIQNRDTWHMTGGCRPTKMEQQITLRVRPGETVRFPALCVACGQPASERLALQKRRGQLTRRLDAPLCGECARRLARRSGDEERLLRLSWLAAGLVVVLLTTLVIVILPFESWWPRLILGLATGLAGGALVRRLLVRRAEAAELPERRAVREAARIADFTWRDMTLVFSNERVAERVREMNPTLVMSAARPQESDPAVAALPAPETGDSTV